MRRVEVARVVGGVGPDLEVEEVVHDVVRHVREHDADRGEGEEAPVDARVAVDGEQPAEARGHERHRQHAGPGDPQPLRDRVERALRRVGGGEDVQPLLGQALALPDDGVGHARRGYPLPRRPGRGRRRHAARGGRRAAVPSRGDEPGGSTPGVGRLRPRRSVPAVRRPPGPGPGPRGDARRRARRVGRPRLRARACRAQRSSPLEEHAGGVLGRRRRGRGLPGRRWPGTCSPSTRPTTRGCAGSCPVRSRPAASRRCGRTWRTSSTRLLDDVARRSADGPGRPRGDVRLPAPVHRDLRAARRRRSRPRPAGRGAHRAAVADADPRGVGPRQGGLRHRGRGAHAARGRTSGHVRATTS